MDSAINPKDLLSVDIFFDLRGVHGDGSLAIPVQEDAFDAADGQAPSQSCWLESCPARSSQVLPSSVDFAPTDGRIDLKRAGLFGIVATARTLAIRHHVMERSTPSRLAGVKALGLGGGHDLDALVEAQGVFLDLLLDQQIKDMEHGVPASNAVAIKRLSHRDP